MDLEVLLTRNVSNSAADTKELANGLGVFWQSAAVTEPSGPSHRYRVQSFATQSANRPFRGRANDGDW